MIWLILLHVVALLLALLHLGMTSVNLPLFKLPEDDHQPFADGDPYPVSLLIPARDEAAGIRQSIDAALASQHVDLEIVVMDDGSTDGTDEIVRQIAATDPRVVYVRGDELPAGWNGKQHACWKLSQHARYDRMVFIDADVRLKPLGLATLCRRQDATGVALLSAFPHQVTETFWEKLLIPMMHFILLGYLPFSRMRATTDLGFAAGCGQLFMTRKADYHAAGTHAAIRGSRHDGVKLPRAYRDNGLSTDVVDGTSLASCRMYTSAAEVFRGALKNATEGIASPKLIVPFTVLLIGGHVLPWVLVLSSQPDRWIQTTATTWLLSGMWVMAVFALACSVWSRLSIARSLHHRPLGVLFHPIAVLVFVILQWIALFNHLTGRQVAWRGRTET